jgi:hypothetical protein
MALDIEKRKQYLKEYYLNNKEKQNKPKMSIKKKRMTKNGI